MNSTGDTPRWYVDDGCHEDDFDDYEDFPGSYRPNSFNAGVRCCDIYSVYCRTVGKCPGQYTHDEAVKMCSFWGMRLCTKDELLSDVCCGQGGQCDNYPVWTSTLESGED